MKINEFKIPDDEQYSEEDINAVINQAINGTWSGPMTIDEFREIYLTQLPPREPTNER